MNLHSCSIDWLDNQRHIEMAWGQALHKHNR